MFARTAVLGVVSVLISLSPGFAGTSYYVDCSRPSNGDGTRGAPFNDLASVNAHVDFQPGDAILLERGTACSGTLAPHGSGSGTTIDAELRIDAYGTGSLPRIDAGADHAQAILLFNQQYWRIRNVETAGGTEHGIKVDGDSSARLRHIWIQDSVVGDTPASGGSAICLCQGGEYGFRRDLGDVLVENVTVHDSGADGIYASGVGVTIRGNTVHDVGASGIWVGASSNVLMERNLVHDTGLDPLSGGNIGIWQFLCTDCVVQWNEVYNTTSGDLRDGGAFDVDFGSVNNTVQYNYAHDVDGYCVSVFGATAHLITENIVIRYNVCSNTGLGPLRHPGFSPEGSIYLETWSGGKLNGIQIYNNTFYANPAAHVPVLHEVWDIGRDLSVRYEGSLPNFFRNNLVYSEVPEMISTTPSSAMEVDSNLYFSPAVAEDAAAFVFRGDAFTGFAAYRQATGQDAHGLFADPLLVDPTHHGVGWPQGSFDPLPGSPLIDAGADVCSGVPLCSPGTHDFARTPVPQGAAFDIGAIEDAAP